MSQLSANAGKGRGKGRPFVKGQSGNPGGRSRAPLDVQALAREHTPAAIAALAAALDSPRERVAAAVALLDRAWGKPTQVVAGDEERPVAIRFEWAPALDQQPDGLAAPIIDGEASTTEPGPLVVEWETESSC